MLIQEMNGSELLAFCQEMEIVGEYKGEGLLLPKGFTKSSKETIEILSKHSGHLTEQEKQELINTL